MAKKIKGIRSWLLIPTIQFIFSVIGMVFGMILSLFFYKDFVIFIFSVILALLALTTLIFEFKKNRRFPNLAILTLWFTVLAIFFFREILSENFNFILIENIVWSIIWTAYLKKSKRVKNTFVK